PNFWQHLEQRLRYLEESNIRLDKENKKLQEQIEQIKPIHIENINYKIQELVVKELSGTLNIGMTGFTDPQELAKWVSEETTSEENEINLRDLEQGEDESMPYPLAQEDMEDING